MKKIIFSLALISLIVFGICWSRNVKESRFNISGRVEVPERLVRMAQADNNSLAIIVKNEADVPVAIKRVVNPKFPLPFELGEKDLLTENVEGNLKIEVQINNHGQLGVIKQGDIFGSATAFVHSNDKEVLVQADKTMGRVQLSRNVKGNFFRTAAR
jgi:hypothetical protein